MNTYTSKFRWLLTAAILTLVAWILLPMQAVWAACGDTNPRTVVCVDTDAAGAATGLSWTDAFTNVQDALAVTNANGSTDYEIWVAEGAYYPDVGADTLADSEMMSFTVRYNNVQLYGGFAGTETLRAQRDWETNATILSGDLQQDDTDPDGDGIIITATHIITPNAYHVLWLDGVTNEPITETTIIDGFTITAGQADGSYPHSHGGGLYCDGNGTGNECSPTLTNITFIGNQANYGGGMYNNGSSGTSSPALTYVTFSGNQANYNGGGMFNASFNGNSSPVLNNVIFNSNQAHRGGGMFNAGFDGNSSPVLTNVIFSGNQAYAGGGMLNDGESGISDPVLINVIFSGNQAHRGGGMFNDGFNSGNSNPKLTNVTFSGNQGTDKGGGIYNWGFSGTSNPTLTNVILWGNTANTGTQIYNDNASASVNYSLVEGGYVGTNNLDTDPRFIAPITATAAPTTAGNYRLQAASPAIDAGNNDAITITTDLDGNPRFVDIPTVPDTGNGTSPIVDMGAYEAMVTSQLCHVRLNDSPNAYPTVQAAIDAAQDGDTVKVAGTCAGVQSRGGLSQTAYISKSLTLRGSYTTTNWTTSHPVSYPTTLDAQGQGRVVLITNTLTTTIEGLILANGDATGLAGGPAPGTPGAGGGLYVYTGTTTVQHCSMTSNTAQVGGGVYVGFGSSVVQSSTLSNNWTAGFQDSGGGVCVYSTTATLQGNRVFSNASERGGGVYVWHSGPTVRDNVIYSNTASSAGGGVYNYDGAPVIQGNEIYSNTANQGGGISSQGGAPMVQENIIHHNHVTSGGGGILSNGGRLTAQKNVIYGNTADWGGGLGSADATTVQNSLFYDNRARLGGGLGAIAGWLTVRHATIYSNTATEAGGGIYSPYLVLSNTIVVSNTAGSTGGGIDSGGSSTLDYNDVWGNSTDYNGVTGGPHSLSADPLFVDAGGADFHLAPDSPCIDTGDPGTTVSRDIENSPRPLGNGYDIGAYEFSVVEPTGVAIDGPTTGVLSTTYAFTATVNPTTTTPITYEWQTSQGVITHTGGVSDTAVFSWTTVGTHAITVTAMNSASAVSATHAISISAPPTQCTPLRDVALAGSSGAQTGETLTFTGVITPADATEPLTLTWAPAPLSGQGALTTTYRWATPGLYTLTLRAENCSGSAAPATVTATYRVDVNNPPPPPPPPLDAVTIHGPTSGLVNTRYVLTATVRPITAATPISFTWTPTPRNGQGQSWAEYVGAMTGPYPITLTAQNAGGIATDTHTLTLSDPPDSCPAAVQDVTLLGPSEGYTGTAYAFTAVLTPAGATLPYTYTWSPSPDTGQGADTVTYTWDTPGTRAVTVTAANCGGAVLDTRDLVIHPRPAPVRGDVYEPDDTCAAAGQALRIPTDGTVQHHTFHARGDEDWVRFSATAGVTYTIQAQVPPTSPANLTLELHGDCVSDPIDDDEPAFSPAVQMTFVAPQDGDYFIRLFNVPDTVYGSDVTYRLSVHALSDVDSTGALVIVAGKRSPGDPQQANINRVAHSVYQYALAHGCRPENIYYLTTDPQQSGSNGPPSRTALQHALTTWAASGDRVDAEWPFTLFMVDHGDADRFYLNGITETISPSDLDTWLAQIEDQTGARTNTIIEACKSGSFITPPTALSTPGRKRVVIASTGATNLAYASQDGAIFSDALLSHLADQPSLATAFETADEATRQARSDQTPWLDDNGDGQPNTEDDGARAALRSFACQPIASPRHTPYVDQVQVRRLSPALDRGEIWAQALDDREVKQVWAEITPPSYRPAKPGDELTPSPSAKLVLRRQGNDWYGERYTAFDEVGLYRVIIYAQDDEGLLGQSREIQVAVPENYRHITPAALPTTLHIPIGNYTTTVDVPVGAFTTTTTFTHTGFTDLSGFQNLTGLEGDFQFAGRGFELTAYQYGVLQHGFTFSHPVTITVRYSDADVKSLDEGTLALFYRDGDAWRADGLTVTRRLTATNEVVVWASHLTEFGLFGQERGYMIYLPLVLRE